MRRRGAVLKAAHFIKHDVMAQFSELISAFATGESAAHNGDCRVSIEHDTSIKRMSEKSKKTKKKPSHLTAASSVLQGLLGNVQSPLAGPFLRYKIWRYWDEIVGVSVAKISVPVE